MTEIADLKSRATTVRDEIAKLHQERVKLAVELHAAGTATDEIGELLGISRSYVYKFLKAENVELRKYERTGKYAKDARKRKSAPPATSEAKPKEPDWQAVFGKRNRGGGA